jgi:formamidopyrimidine-DNA glycosylase
MPELPEVETVCRQLNSALSGGEVTSANLWLSGKETPEGEAFVEALEGRTIKRIERRAKIITWRFEDADDVLLTHLKMTGRVELVEPSYERGKHDRLHLTAQTDAGARHAVWSDVRKFGYMKFLSRAAWKEYEQKLGPEPLETDPEKLAALFKKPKTRKLKAALLNQRVIAGIGNIYADEACHRAGIRPTKRLRRVTVAQRNKLARAIQTVLGEAIEHQGTTIGDYVNAQGAQGNFVNFLRVYGKGGDPCQTCETPIKKVTVAQRSTHYCPNCQS